MASAKTTLSVLAIPALVVVAVVAASSLFIVDEREKALVLRLGRVVDVQETPGLGFKLPFIDNVVKYDGRILGLPTSPLEVTPLDDRRLVVDAFARWRITDPVRFRQASELTASTHAVSREISRCLSSSFNSLARLHASSFPSSQSVIAFLRS